MDLNKIFDTFNSMSTGILKDIWLPGIYNVIRMKRRSFLVNQLKASQDGVEGKKVNLAFLKNRGWSFRPMSSNGYTATSSPMEGAVQYATLQTHTANAMVTHDALLATKGEASRIGDLINSIMQGIHEDFPLYMTMALWCGSTGIIGTVGSISTLVVTLANTGLNHVNVFDRAKYFVDGMWVQAITATGAKRGSPVRVDYVDKYNGKITLSEIPSGLTATDMFVTTDVAGLENGYNQFSPGILEVIDDDNTFQGMDRSQAANAKFRALVDSNNGTGRKPTYERLNEFFYRLFNPDYAVTDHRVIDKIFTSEIQGKIQYAGKERSYNLGYEYIQIGTTKLTADEDAHMDKIIVPDLNNMEIKDTGALRSLFDKGWERVPGRPFMENPLVYDCTLIAEDCRYMGKYEDVDINAAS